MKVSVNTICETVEKSIKDALRVGIILKPCIRNEEVSECYPFLSKSEVERIVAFYDETWSNYLPEDIKLRFAAHFNREHDLIRLNKQTFPANYVYFKLNEDNYWKEFLFFVDNLIREGKMGQNEDLSFSYRREVL